MRLRKSPRSSPSFDEFFIGLAAMAETSTIECESRDFAPFALSGCTRIWKTTLLYGGCPLSQGKCGFAHAGSIRGKIQIRLYGDAAANFLSCRPRHTRPKWRAPVNWEQSASAPLQRQIKEARQTRGYCVANHATHRSARPDPSLGKKRWLGMTSHVVSGGEAVDHYGILKNCAV